MVRSMSRLWLVGVGGCGSWVMRGDTVVGVIGSSCFPFRSEMESASIAAAFGAGDITWFPLGEHGTSGISCILSCSLMCVS